MSRKQTPASTNERVGRNLKALRQAAGLTQTELAARLTDEGHPFAQQTVLKVERGTRPLKLDEAVDLANILDVTVGDLIFSRADGDALAEMMRAETMRRHAERELEEAQDELARAKAEYERACADEKAARDRAGEQLRAGGTGGRTKTR